MSRELAGYTSPHHEGAWSSANNYTPLAIVTNSGSSYLAKKAVPAGTALNNSVYWGLLASVGSDPNITITLTSSVGLVDTYTWTDATSGNTGTFTVTNGQDGEITGDVIATPYDNTAAYKVGNLLTYLGKQYEVTGDDGVAPPVGTLPTDTDYFTERPVSEIIEMIKNGSIVTGHSEVADNLTPYSEDSGTTQENPFISQGTGTDNNSVIVTTGAIARQLEKQGNTVGKNQLLKVSTVASETEFTYGSKIINNNDGSYTIVVDTGGATATHSITLGSSDIFIGNADRVGHRCIVLLGKKDAYTYFRAGYKFTSNPIFTSDGVAVVNNSGYSVTIGVLEGTPAGTYKITPKIVDLDQWGFSADIITDLTSHPEHFSWYYNGSLAYDAGSLANCNGRYLECGQGRNLFDQVMELGGIDAQGQNTSVTNLIRSQNYILVVPNTPYYLYCGKAFTDNKFNVYFYDANKNFVSYINGQDRNTTFVVPANAWFVRFLPWVNYGTTYTYDISIEKYYSPAEGGEGYGEMHDYIAPIRIDTGNETLKAFDKKLPSGVIERNTGEIDLGILSWTYAPTGYSVPLFYANVTTKANGLTNMVTAKYVTDTSGAAWSAIPDKGIKGDASSFAIAIHDSSYTDAETFKAAMAGVMLQFELANPTTEQGTQFSEYAQINDYSYMAWFDTDGNLVSIPQGCKLFYPVDYKGFTDDLVMYTNGDATALAKNEDITDTALNARGYYKMQDLLTAFGADGMVGGALRQTLANAKSLDFNNTNCVDLGSLSWLYIGNNLFMVSDVGLKPVANNVVTNALSTKYKSVSYEDLSGGTVNYALCGYVGDGRLYIKDTTYTDATAFKNAMNGVLLAFEKAST